MPRYMKVLSATALGMTALVLLMMVFGPQEGLETLATGLLAYFSLLYHMAIGPAFVHYWYTTRRISPGFVFMACYLLLIYAIGLYQFIQINDLDEAAADFMESQTDPQSHRIRELGAAIYFQHKFEHQVDASDRAEWHRLAGEAANLNRRDPERQPALWYAAAIGDLQMVDALLAAGADTDADALYFTTPLAAAVEEGHVHVVARLVAAGANPDRGSNGDTPSLAVAARNNDLEMVRVLLGAGADPALGEPTPFAIALKASEPEMVAMLLDAGAPDVLPWQNRLPVEVVADDAALLAVLMEKTAGFEQRTEGRDPALFNLLPELDIDHFVSYLEMGADPNVLSNRGLSLFSRVIQLDMASGQFEPLRLQFAQALIDAGADLHLQDERNPPLLLQALRRGHADVAHQLVAARAPMRGELERRDVLMLAAQLGMNDLVQLAVSEGFDPNRWTEGLNRSNALYEAAAAGHAETVAVLIDLGARLPQVDVDVRNLFRKAGEHPAVLRLLLDQYLVQVQAAEAAGLDLDLETAIKFGVRDSGEAAAAEMLEAMGIKPFTR